MDRSSTEMGVQGYDILVRNARLRHRDGFFDIGIANGLIQKIEGRLEGSADIIIDARENLVTEAFCNAHLHLCKVYTLGRVGEKALMSYQGTDMKQAMTAIEEAAENVLIYDEELIFQNACRALDTSVKFGTLCIRAFVDVGPQAGLSGIRALLRAKARYSGVVHLQIVAFPQLGIVRAPGTEELVEQAVREGADIVGGIPWIEYTHEDELLHIRKMFAIARKYDKSISMLVDDAGDPGLKTLEMLACEAIREGWEGRVMAQHARAMCLYPVPYLQKVIALLRRADITLVSDPHTGPLHACVKELHAQGVCVCLGQDDISDAYYPYGRSNMLEVAFLASHLLWMTTDEDREAFYDMITCLPARGMGFREYGVEVGSSADLIVLREDNLLDAFRNHDAPSFVISRGRIVAESNEETRLTINVDASEREDAGHRRKE